LAVGPDIASAVVTVHLLQKNKWLNNVVLVYLLMHQFLLGKMYCEIQRTASGSSVCPRGANTISTCSCETAKDANIKVQPLTL
jgi:hypothetical protein